MSHRPLPCHAARFKWRLTLAQVEGSREALLVGPRRRPGSGLQAQLCKHRLLRSEADRLAAAARVVEAPLTASRAPASAATGAVDGRLPALAGRRFAACDDRDSASRPCTRGGSAAPGLGGGTAENDGGTAPYMWPAMARRRRWWPACDSPMNSRRRRLHGKRRQIREGRCACRTATRSVGVRMLVCRREEDEVVHPRASGGGNAAARRGGRPIGRRLFSLSRESDPTPETA